MQHRKYPCNPVDVDVFVETHKRLNHDVAEAISKVILINYSLSSTNSHLSPILVTQSYIPGGCFSDHKKYCPTRLQSCLQPYNYGYKWSISGGDVSRIT